MEGLVFTNFLPDLQNTFNAFLFLKHTVVVFSSALRVCF